MIINRIVKTAMVKLGILLIPNILESHEMLCQLSNFHSRCCISVSWCDDFRGEPS